MSFTVATLGAGVREAMNIASREIQQRREEVQAFIQNPQVRAVAFQAISRAAAAFVTIGAVSICALATWFVVLPVATVLIKVTVTASCLFYIVKAAITLYLNVSDRVLNHLNSAVRTGESRVDGDDSGAAAVAVAADAAIASESPADSNLESAM